MTGSRATARRGLAVGDAVPHHGDVRALLRPLILAAVASLLLLLGGFPAMAQEQDQGTATQGDSAAEANTVRATGFMPNAAARCYANGTLDGTCSADERGVVVHTFKPIAQTGPVEYEVRGETATGEARQVLVDVEVVSGRGSSAAGASEEPQTQSSDTSTTGTGTGSTETSSTGTGAADTTTTGTTTTGTSTTDTSGTDTSTTTGSSDTSGTDTGSSDTSSAGAAGSSEPDASGSGSNEITTLPKTGPEERQLAILVVGGLELCLMGAAVLLALRSPVLSR